MPVHTSNKKRDELLDLWQTCRDVICGDRAVKGAGERYLPKLAEQDADEYEKYKLRATFFGATRRTLHGLLGAMFRKEPEIEPPSAYVRSIVDDVAREVLETGRAGVLVDVGTGGGNPYMVLYKAEDIINWAYDAVDGKVVIRRVVLRETTSEQSEDDPFETDDVVRYRVVEISADGLYHSAVWENRSKDSKKEDWVEVSNVIPVMRGAAMNFIPFTFINALNDKPDIDEPPLADIARINISHYRTSADLEHGRHYTALPTPWVSGFDPSTKLVLGAGQAWVTDNVSARAGFLEFTGAGLSTLVEALQEKQEMMAVSGSRMLEGQRVGVEAAETARIHKAGEEATITAIAKNISAAMTKAYQWLNDFRLTAGGTTAIVALNTDYIASQLDPAMIAALLANYQAGVISLETLLWNLKQGEIIPDERTIEDERALAEAGQARLVDMLAKVNGGGKPSGQSGNEDDNADE